MATIASVISAANEDSSDDEDFLFDWLIREEAEIRRSVTSTVDVINFSLHTIRQMYQGRDLQTYIRMSEGEFLTILANLQVCTRETVRQGYSISICLILGSSDFQVHGTSQNEQHSWFLYRDEKIGDHYEVGRPKNNTFLQYWCQKVDI